MEFQKFSGFPAPHFEKKLQALISEGRIGKEKIVVVFPEMGMNKSGAPLKAAARKYRARPDHIFIIHDDADIMLGRTKLSFGRHAAGHKGVASILTALGTRDVWRFRIGIAGKRDIPAQKLVLKKWTTAELPLARKTIKKTVAALKTVITETPEKTMNEYNR